MIRALREQSLALPNPGIPPFRTGAEQAYLTQLPLSSVALTVASQLMNWINERNQYRDEIAGPILVDLRQVKPFDIDKYIAA